MSNRSRTVVDDASTSESSDWRTVLKKATVAGSEWNDKDDLLDVVYWQRQIVSAVIGGVWAVVPLHGLLAILLYLALSTAFTHVFVTAYQKVDEDVLGGAWEIAKEGFGAGFATFMIMWIVGYSALHFE